MYIITYILDTYVYDGNRFSGGAGPLTQIVSTPPQKKKKYFAVINCQCLFTPKLYSYSTAQ